MCVNCRAQLCSLGNSAAEGRILTFTWNVGCAQKEGTWQCLYLMISNVNFVFLSITFKKKFNRPPKEKKRPCCLFLACFLKKESYCLFIWHWASCTMSHFI